MAYVKIVYQNSPSTATPLNAENLNHMDDQIALNDQRLTEIETSYVKSFNGRKGEVTPQSGDYNIGQITPLTGAQVGQVPVVVNHGTEQDPELVFEMGAGGGGGHSIIDSEGNTMPQEDAMQFADSFVSDDDVNGKTVVENVKEVASADYSSETEDGMYLIPDGEGAVIEPASDDVEEVTADGNTTYAQLLKDLNVDVTKLTDMSVILVGGQIFNFAYDGSEYWFTRTYIDGTTSKMSFDRLRRMSNGNWSCIKIDTSNTLTDQSSLLIPQGTVITLYYGNKKATVDLQTTANRCLMGDGVTSVADMLTVKHLSGFDAYGCYKYGKMIEAVIEVTPSAITHGSVIVAKLPRARGVLYLSLNMSSGQSLNCILENVPGQNYAQITAYYPGNVNIGRIDETLIYIGE